MNNKRRGTITAIIAAGGHGSRLLPLTKGVSKELIPFGDKPIIDFVIDEIIAAGLNNLIVVCNSENIEQLQNHLSGNKSLTRYLRSVNKSVPAYESHVKKLSGLNIKYVIEEGRYGNYSAVTTVFNKFVNVNRAICYFPDDFMLSGDNRSKTLIESIKHNDFPTVTTVHLDIDEAAYYGTIEKSKDMNGVVKSIKEKQPFKASTSMKKHVVTGCTYITREFVEAVCHNDNNHTSEPTLTIALNNYIISGGNVRYVEIDGKYIDTGNMKQYISNLKTYLAELSLN